MKLERVGVDEELHWNPRVYGTPHTRAWALRKASGPGGFMPDSKIAAVLLQRLEGRGLLYRDGDAPLWKITEAGRAERLRNERNGA